MSTAAEVSKELLSRAKARVADPKRVWGVPYGYPSLDENTGGMQQHEVTILMARPGVGKTAFFAEVAAKVARWTLDNRPGEVVKLVLVEMTMQQFQERLAASLADVTLKKIRSGDLDRDEFDRLEYALEELALLPIEYLDSPRSIDHTMTWLDSGSKAAMFGVDYIQIHPFRPGRFSPTERVSELSTAFRSAAKEIAPGFLLSQMSRLVEDPKRTDKRPQLPDLRDSGQLEADAAVVLGLYRQDIYLRPSMSQQDRPKPAELLILKNRNGGLGTVPMVWHPAQVRFSDAGEGLQPEAG